MNNNDDDNNKKAAPNQLQPQNDIDETTMAMALEALTAMKSTNCNENESENAGHQAVAAAETVDGVPLEDIFETAKLISSLTLPFERIDLSNVHQMPEDLSSFDPRIVDSVKKTIDFRKMKSKEQHVPFRRNCGRLSPNPKVFAAATSPDAALLILIQWRYKSQEEQKKLNERYWEDTDTDERRQYNEHLRVLMNIPKETRGGGEVGDIVDGKILVGNGDWVTLERYAEIERLKKDAKNRVQNAVALIQAAKESGRLRDLEQMCHTAYVDENNKPPVRSVTDYSREIREAVDNVKLAAERLDAHGSYENYHGLKHALEHLKRLSPGWSFDYKYKDPVPPALGGNTIPLVSSYECKTSTCSGHICTGDKLQLQDCLKTMVAMGFSLHSVVIVPLHAQWYEDHKVPLPSDEEFELALSTGDILRCKKETRRDKHVTNDHCVVKDEGTIVSKPVINRDKGRYTFCLRGNNYLYVSMAICYAFHGPPPDGNGWDVDHINRDTLDNRPENLRWAKNKRKGEQAMNQGPKDLVEMNKHFEN